MRSNSYVTHIYLQMASNYALVAHHTEAQARKHYLENVRRDLINALSGCDAGDTKNSEELLRDKISNAILDSMDPDWNSDMGAEAVIEALFDFGETS